MSYSNPLYGIVSTNNSNNSVASVAYNANDGLASSATSTTIVLAASASAVDNFYNDLVVHILHSTGEGQRRIITSYVGASKTATVNYQWGVIPDSTSNYIIYANSGIVNGSIYDQLTLSTTASSITNHYQGAFVKISDGTGIGQIRQIVYYDGSTRTAAIDKTWIEFPDSTSYYEIYGESGTAVSGTLSTIVLDGNQSSFVIAGLIIEIIAGTGFGQSRMISSILVDTVTVNTDWTTIPDNTSVYHIYAGYCGIYEPVDNYSSVSVSYHTDITNHESAIIAIHFSSDINQEGDIVKYVEANRNNQIGSHQFTIIAEYYRLYAVAIGTTLSGSFQSILHKTKSGKLTSFVNSPIFDENDVDLTRSIITGRTSGGMYKNAMSDSFGNLGVNINNPTTAFGELLVQNQTPVAQVAFPYGVNARDTDTYISNPITLTVEQRGSASTHLIQYMTVPAGSLFNSSGAGNYFILTATATGKIAVWYNRTDGSTTGPTPSPGVIDLLLQVDITGATTPSQVAIATAAVTDASGTYVSCTVSTGNVLRFENVFNQDIPTINISNMPTVKYSSLSHSEGMAALTIGTGTDCGVGDYTVVRTRRSLKYRPGLGCMTKFVAMFGTPLTGVSQWAGMFSSISALVFGYNGDKFGIMKKTRGVLDIWELKINSPATGTTPKITLYIAGANVDISLTADTAQVNAREIASIDYTPYGYLATAVNDTVIFMAQTDGTKLPFAIGTLSAGTISLTFTQVAVGATAVSEWVYQSEWNVDRMDGYGPSGQHLIPQYGNVYQINYQWLGFGQIVFSIESQIDGRITPVHAIKYTNSNTYPSLTIPHMTAGWTVFSTTATTSSELKGTAVALMVQGPIRRFDPVYTTSSTITSISTLTLPILTIENIQVYNGYPNLSEIYLKSLSVVVSGARVVRFDIYKNLTFPFTSSGPLYQYIEKGNSVAAIDSNAVSFSGGIWMLSFVIGSNGTTVINLEQYNLLLQKNETITVTGTQLSAGTGVDISVSVTWVEDQ